MKLRNIKEVEEFRKVIHNLSLIHTPSPRDRG